ncbi:hypothetical protein ACFFTN_01490 [Aminobacter aganoensis]|uniref:Uncharacterized protein n=1 Tax=Aminobacter aganoensis TaxID=83264 RepID=A0A7X0F5E6_9HYPH|nr:hypothetical protein [Aminobacter aganoensis]MBB6353466.1 hypothetical protein [Aminobacter aganoensis]
MAALLMAKPIKAPGLFDAAKAGGQTFDQWNAAKGDSEAMPSIAPQQVNDSVADKVTALSSQDSKLNQMARTEGLKSANRRGLLNSSMAVGAAQDAVIKNVLPIASQDASQDFARNENARNFEYSMAAQNDAQAFAGTQAGLDRTLQREMQASSITAAESQQIRDIASREGLAAADRALQTMLVDKDIGFRTAENKLDRDLQQRIATLNLNSSDRNAAAQFLTSMEDMFNRSQQSIMANTALDATQRTQQLNAAKALRDKQLSFVEQMYDIDIKW